MKKSMFLFGALLAVGLSFTACSSDNDVADNNGPIENGGSNYIAISINLPTNSATMTRTSDNGGNIAELNDGLEGEYAVNDATLIIFDASGVFKEAITITDKVTPWPNSGDPHVTKVSKKVVQKVNSDVAKDYQMLVILNHNNLIEVQTGGGLKVMKNGALTDFTGNFSDLTDEANKYFATTTGLDCGAMNASGFYMANAPLADKQGSTATAITGATAQVLVKISKVYPTESEANGGTADQIYVERGMAKVTMDNVITTPALSNSKLDGATTLNGTVTGWTIDNTNPQSFLVRSTNNHSSFLSLISNSTAAGAAVYRYIGNQAITEGSPSTYKYRTYFAESANYAKGTALNHPSSFTFSDEFGDDHPQYCFENTFSVDDQDVNKTTLVQVAIQAIANGGSAADLYTVNGNKSYIYNLASLTTLIQDKALAYIQSQTGWVTSGSIASTEINVGTITVDANNKVTSIALTCTPASATVDATKFYKDGTGTDKTLPDAVYTYVLSQTGDILKYVNGISYYNIRIKHFGDLLTPWKNLESPQPSTGTIYPATNKDNNYLGRYGVLRNNWYNLKVKTIRSLGEATPHTATWPDTPDDELDNYITFQINILSWAKHVTQNADL